MKDSCTERELYRRQDGDSDIMLNGGPCQSDTLRAMLPAMRLLLSNGLKLKGIVWVDAQAAWTASWTLLTTGRRGEEFAIERVLFS